MQRDAARLRGQLEFLEHVLHEIDERERLALGLHAARFEPREPNRCLREPADLSRERDRQVAPPLVLGERVRLQRQCSR